jgi:RNA polymerase sigma factor (sigma-70 family)
VQPGANSECLARAPEALALSAGPRAAESRRRDRGGAAEQTARSVDAGLVRRCRAGDETAWTAIVERFSSYVYAITIRYGLSDDRAQDVFQDVFSRAYRHLDSLRDEGALKPWIAQLARRAAVDRLRSDGRGASALDADATADEDPGLARIELAMTVQRALEELPAQYGEALRRFFIYDQSYRTIGAALGIPPGTVASRISRGLSQLRTTLDQRH